MCYNRFNNIVPIMTIYIPIWILNTVSVIGCILIILLAIAGLYTIVSYLNTDFWH